MVGTAQTSRPTSFSTRITANRRVEVVRRGPRLQMRVTGKALTEAEARKVVQQCLSEGEQLLDCIARDGGRALSYRFTFIVWPRSGGHTGRILDQLRTAA